MNRNLARDFSDLIHHHRAGHMGHWEYVAPDGPALWAKFLKENPAYYILNAEIQLAKAIAVDLADIVHEPICLVPLGHGGANAFKQKELVATSQFNEVAQIELYDQNRAYIRACAKAARAANPAGILGMRHADIFTRFDVLTPHTKLGMIWGQTLFNEEGFVSDGPPEIVTITRLMELKRSLWSGFLGITQDANQDKDKVEKAYAGQTEFAINMLRLVDRYTSHQPTKPFGFRVQFHPRSFVLAHYLTMGGEEFHFNNSYKLPPDMFLDWARRSGFDPVYNKEHDGIHFHLLKA